MKKWISLKLFHIVLRKSSTTAVPRGMVFSLKTAALYHWAVFFGIRIFTGGPNALPFLWQLTPSSLKMKSGSQLLLKSHEGSFLKEAQWKGKVINLKWGRNLEFPSPSERLPSSASRWDNIFTLRFSTGPQTCGPRAPGSGFHIPRMRWTPRTSALIFVFSRSNSLPKRGGLSKKKEGVTYCLPPLSFSRILCVATSQHVVDAQ